MGGMGDTYHGAVEAYADRARQKAQTIPDRTQEPAHRIEAQVICYGGRGPVYRVTYAGEVLIKACRCPLFDACRALLARGMTGRLELWCPGKATFDAACDVQVGARHTIAESETRSLQLAPWSSWDAVCRATVEPRTATDVSPVPKPHPDQTPILDVEPAK
jgi:hypothetical protein